MMWPLGKAVVGVRPLGPDDSSSCARLHALSFAHPWSAGEFESLLMSRSVSGWAAAAGSSRLKGFVVARQAVEEAEVLTLAVAAGDRRRGLGLNLMLALRTSLSARGVKLLHLEVDEGNEAALRLYSKLGFERVGLRKAYYRRADGSSSSALLLTLRM